MIDPAKIDALSRRLSDVLPEGGQQVASEIRTRFRQILHQGLEGLDLVSREEFEVQKAVLQRSREKLEALAKQLDDL
ncbi:MAG: accessory factor UbiK family protein [Xanthomonadales bacterium]|nr:accessory factor UbiK family protein [Xanthomonadales bacterium]